MPRRHSDIVQSHFLPLLLSWIRENIAPPSAEKIGRFVEPPDGAEDMVQPIGPSLETYRELGDAVARELGDEFLGVRLAQDCPRGCFGLVEFAARSAPTVGKALRKVYLYQRLLSGGTYVDLKLESDHVSIGHKVRGDVLGVGRHGNEFVLALFLKFVRDVSGQPIRALRVEFAHPAPSDVSRLVQHFGTAELQFASERNVVVFDPSIVSLPVASHDPELMQWLDSCAVMLLSQELREVREPTFLRRLHEHIGQGLQAEESATLEQVARRLRCSARTLQRQLARYKTSFQNELDKVRRKLADSYLRDPGLSIYEVARLLGYSDLSGFHRAFTKWHGVTPRSFRRRLERPTPRPRPAMRDM